jgi:outer membrane protein assembly factor BamB
MKVRKTVYWKQVALLGCLLLFSACCEQADDEAVATETRDESGVVTDKSHLWKTDVTGKGLAWALLSPAVYKNIVAVAGATSAEKDIIIGLNIDTGEEVWRWSDFLTLDRASGMNDSEYEINQKDNVWLLQDGRFYYAIDLANGETLWKEKRKGQPFGSEGIQIIGDGYYTGFNFEKDSISTPTLVRGDIYSASFEKIVEPPIDTIQLFSNWYGGMSSPIVYQEKGQLHAFLQFSSNVDVYTSKYFHFIASYNLTTNQYDLEKTQLGDTSVTGSSFSGRPTMYQDIMVVNPDGQLYGVNKHTGEVIWHRDEFDTNGDGVFTHAIYQDRLFCVNNIGVTSRVMALNPLTGETIWEDIGRGNAAHSLHFLNGVMYFSSRGDGHLYAYDTDTGELLWQLNSPEFESFQGSGGVRAIPGKDGEKGKIIACTYATAYCYEAIR